MAKEILEAVTNAEAECERIIQQAKENAKLTAENAKKQADDFQKSSDDGAKTEAETMLSDVKIECDNIIKNAQNTAETECAALSEFAEKNRESVIRQAVEKFF